MKNKGFTLVELLVLIILGSILLLLIIVPIVIAVSNKTKNTPPANLQTDVISKPMVISECDFFGVASESIIKTKKENGYRFTGRTKNLWCDNLLMFELEEK